MSSQSPFQPLGKTVAIAVSTTPSTPVQVPTGIMSNCYRIYNSTSQACFFVGGGSSAAVATSAANGGGHMQPGNSVEVMRYSPGSWFSAYTPTGTTTLYLTPGDGV